MARKRRAPDYTGALAQPIYLDPDDYKYAGGLGQLTDPNVVEKKMREMMQKQAFEKMQLLFKHYEIDPSDEQRWQALAFSLAITHVPGLQVASRPKPGRKPTWKTGLGDELVRAKSRTGKGTKEAIADLRKEPKWKKYSAQNLEARYREARARQKVLASLHEAWLNEINIGLGLAAPSTTVPLLGRAARDDQSGADEN
jgi:hypothetical protein